jgi:hypothetical protein
MHSTGSRFRLKLHGSCSQLLAHLLHVDRRQAYVTNGVSLLQTNKLYST